MANWPERLLGAIAAANPAHAAKLRRCLPLAAPGYIQAANTFFDAWLDAATLPTVVRHYLELIEDMTALQQVYARTGNYPFHTFSDAERAVYADHARMSRHLDGLGLAQFLWIDQVERFRFFQEWLAQLEAGPYLEIGPGHGLYLQSALARSALAPFTVVDVSAASLERARCFAGEDPDYVHADCLSWSPPQRFQALTFAEVLEHVEAPTPLLNRLHTLLQPGGTVFFSSPVHAPMPDHILAWPSVVHLRQLLRAHDFTIVRERCVAVDHLPLDTAERLRLPIMYAAILAPRAHAF